MRSANIDGEEVVVSGDVDSETELEVFVPSSVDSIRWNGRVLDAKKTSYGSLKVKLAKPGLDVSSLKQSLVLSGWKYSPALPEASADYDDGRWTLADHTETPNPYKPDTLPVLYADDYGELFICSLKRTLTL